ncbi:MAG: AMP-binding protein [Solirubrobacterales bacterium]|nr:AMP-binding protein [Solirubrobacterales bacterium]
MSSPLGSREDSQAGAAPPRTMCDAFAATVRRCAGRVALRAADGEVITWERYGARARDLAAALHELGVRRGDRLGIVAEAALERHVVDAAAMLLGAIPFFLHPSVPPADVEDVLRSARPRLLIVDDHLEEAVPRHRSLAVSDLPVLEERGAASEFDVGAAASAVAPQDVLALDYTSRRTGMPVGVPVTHAGAVFLGTAVAARLHRLPREAEVVAQTAGAGLAHRAICQYWPMVGGHAVTCCRDVVAAVAAVRATRPHVVAGPVPLFEALWAAAVNAGRPGAPGDARALRAMHGLDRFTYGVATGGRGGQGRLEDLIGLDVSETWGVSECGGIATLGAPGAVRPGTRGTPLPGVEVRLAADGEIQVRSAGVMPGYWERPDLTAEAFTPDGWLRSGDVGELDADGYLSVLGRVPDVHGPAVVTDS